MKRCGYEQNVMTDSVVCPKPRRLGHSFHSINDNIRPLRCPTNNPFQSEGRDSQAGTELLDIILTKGNNSVEMIASSPPYFCGSPPSRASNPLIQDEQFGNGGYGVTKSILVTPTPPSPSARTAGGCARMKFGQKPAAVRIEGFDCLSRDRRNCSISAVA
ncbi:hypothetical protein CsatB_016014 [Cannabis sativa]